MFEFIGNKSTKRAELLAKVLGKAEVSGSGEKFKVRAVGAGLGGTVTILAVAVLAMYVLGNHTVTGG